MTAALPKVVRIVRATRADALADDLAQQMARSSDLCDECFVVVQGLGMANWLGKAMVHRCGAWGGVESPFLREFLQLLGGRAAGKPAPERGREPQRELAYRIVACVARANSAATTEDRALGDRLAPLIAMCASAEGELDLATLLVRARTIAECFDRLEMDRPDLIAAWESPDTPWCEPDKKPSAEASALEEWQRALWRATVPGRWEPHDRWNDLRSLIARLKRGELPDALASIGFVSLFGVSMVPPLAMELLTALAKHRPVSVHLLVPTMQFQELDAGNPLVETLGSLAADAAFVIDQFADAEVIDAEARAAETDGPSDGLTILGELQHAMAENRPCTGAPSRAAGDASLRFHGITTVTRAAEVAYDEILRAFAEIPGLKQEDVIILTPDLPAHAAAMEAVFRERASRDSVQPKLALRVADRSSGVRDGVATLVELAMQLAIEDQSFASVRQLLEHPVALKSLALSVDKAQRLFDALADAHAARFLDDSHRKRWLGVDADGDAVHTVAWALDRLILGLATRDSPAEVGVVDWVLPKKASLADPLPSLRSMGIALDAVAMFVRATARDVRPLSGWIAVVMDLIDTLVPSKDDDEFGASRERIDRDLRHCAAVADSAAMPPIDWPTARLEIATVLDVLIEGRYYAAGGVTIARMAPMRSVPFRVILIVGIEHGEFPRPVRREALDLAALSSRRGDRSPRSEDQLLLLEALHAAGQRLIIIHRDRDPSSGKPVAMAAVLVEIVNAAAEAMGSDPDPARAILTTGHAALADSVEEWQQASTAGFDQWARARTDVAISAAAQPPRSFITEDDDAAGELVAPQAMVAEFKELALVLRNPADAFLKARGIVVKGTCELRDQNREPIELNYLDDWKLRQGAMESIDRGMDEAAALQYCQSAGLLPHGGDGHAAWRVQWDRAFAIKTVEAKVRAQGAHPVLRKKGDSSQDFEPWLAHLSLAAVDDTQRVVAVVYGHTKNKEWVRSSPQESIPQALALATLTEVRDLVARARRTLLPFHGKLLDDWRKCQKLPAEERLAAMREKFMGDSFLGLPPVSEDPSIRLAFRGIDFLAHGRDRDTADCPRSFFQLAAWVDVRMTRTGWGPS